MNDLTKTSVFVGAALVAAAGAIGVYWATQPGVRSDGSDLVHQEFFEEFDVNDVTSMKIAAFDPISQQLREFEVAFSDGLWRIPSHHGYPAESAENLFKTATSLMGLEREAFVGQLKQDQKRLGVIDPTTEDEDLDPDETGTRITLRDINDEVLADIVVGKEKTDVDLGTANDVFSNPNEKVKYFYVRREDETPTYLTSFDLDISTKFSDWIEPDLLKLEADDIDEIAIDNYSLKSQDVITRDGIVKQIAKVQGDQLILRRDDKANWLLDGLDVIREELQSAKITEIVSLLDEMTIVGVRPKTQLEGKPLLNADLSINSELEKLGITQERFQTAIIALQEELDGYGFNIVPVRGERNKLELLSERGQIKVKTKDGTVYNLYFGDLFDGDESEIEIGTTGDKAKSAKNSSAETKTEKPADDAGNPDGEAKSDEADVAQGKSRYLMVSVAFDPEKIQKPVAPIEPVEPVKPEGYVPQSESPENKTEGEPESSEDDPPKLPNDKKAADGTDAEKKPEEKSDDVNKADQEPGDDKPPTEKQDDRDPAFIKYDEDMASFPLAQQEHTILAGRYASELRSYEDSLKAAERKAKELNERFGPWFYVISAGDLNSLKIPRIDLVKARLADPNDPNAIPRRPDISFGDELKLPVELEKGKQEDSDGSGDPGDDKNASDEND